MKERLEKELKQAMKNQDAFKLSLLRMLVASLRNREIEKRGKTQSSALTEEEVMAVLRTEAKKRRDSIEAFTKGKRDDLALQEERELEIITTYLPPELSDEEVVGVVRMVCARMGPVNEKDFGRVMGAVMKELGGRAAGERVSVCVKDALSSL